jgi:hypothetical protein
MDKLRAYAKAVPLAVVLAISVVLTGCDAEAGCEQTITVSDPDTTTTTTSDGDTTTTVTSGDSTSTTKCGVKGEAEVIPK